MTAQTSEPQVHSASREMLRFLLVGGTGALFYVALSTLAVSLAHVGPALASVASHAVLIPVMFWAQRAITFKSVGPPLPEFVKYAALQIASILISTGLLTQLASGDWRVNIVVFSAISLTASLTSFIICRGLIFSKSTAWFKLGRAH